MAAILLVSSKGIFARQQETLAEFFLPANQYDSTVTLPNSFEIPPDSSPLIILYQAPVDQSWVYLRCQLLTASREVATEFDFHLERYYGKRDGRPWEIGSTFGSKTVPRPAGGSYLLRVNSAAGEGSETLADRGRSGPPVKIWIKSGMRTVRLATWTTTILMLMGVALLLRGLIPAREQAPLHVSNSNETPKPRFLFLDGLRGVAVLAVLVCHFFIPKLHSAAPYLEQALSKTVGNLTRHGDLGVEIFFVLSGFVIAHSLGNHPVTPRFAIRFIARRAVRLDPPYYVALGLMLTVVAIYRHDGLFGTWQDYGGWSAALSNLFYLQDLLHQRTPLDISWTLCLEIQFYLTLVAFRMINTFISCRLPDEGKQPRPDLLLFSVLPLLLISLAFWYPAMNRFNFPGTWFRFGLGVLTYLAFRGSIGRIWWSIPMTLIVGLSVFFQDLRGAVAAGTAGLILFAGLSGRLGTWLSNRPIQFFGKLSYSIYLIHLAAGVCVSNYLWDFMEPTPGNALLVTSIGIVSSFGGALLIYHLFEKPGMLISQRLK